MVSFLLHYILFNQNMSVAILANKLATARELLGRLKLAYEYLPIWLQQGVVEWNKGSIVLENGSKVLAAATSSSAVRGGSFNCIMLDEFAYVPQNVAEEFFSSVYPTITSGKETKVIIVSTPKGLNMFYRIWVNANKRTGEEGKNEYYPIEVHWSDVPGRDEEWKKQTI
jgi:phage terminase large subunit-like protein